MDQHKSIERPSPDRSAEFKQNGQMFDELKMRRDQLEELVKKRTAELDEALKQLKSNEERYGYAMEASRDGLWDWNIQTNDTYLNPAYFRMLGYEPGELGPDMNDNFYNQIHPDDRDLIMANIRKRMEEEGAYEVEFRMRCKDGSYKWILSRGKVVSCDHSGKPVRAVGTHTDLTTRKNLEIKLRKTVEELRLAKERAEAADRIKSAFLATMSHELRTPLNSIIGFTGVLLQGLSGAINAEQTKQLAMVKNSANHLLSLISDVLDISKIEAGQLKVAAGAFDMSASVKKVVQSVRPLAEKQGLELTLEIADDVGVIVSDVRRVEQVLLNLLSNAIKFTEKGVIHVTCSVNDGKCIICVSDTGIGIKPEDRERLFRPFSQIDTGMTRKYEGTGLGLSICKRLVELMGGDIWAETGPDRGSLFCFSLPLRKDEESKV